MKGISISVIVEEVKNYGLALTALSLSQSVYSILVRYILPYLTPMHQQLRISGLKPEKREKITEIFMKQ